MRVLIAALHPKAAGAQNRTMERNFGVPVPQVDVLDKSLQFLVGAERQAGTRTRHRREVQFADMPVPQHAGAIGESVCVFIERQM